MALNSIEKLRIWCHKVLPLVYDDSLSYYEVLAKVVNKLNEVITLAEEQNETIEEALSDIESFETDMTSQFNAYKATLEAALDTFEGEITTQQSAFEGRMTQAFADFLADYEREFGITNLYGDSTTLAISQNQVSKLLDYTTNNNRFNPEVITSGKAIDNSGAVIDNPNTAVTGYIEVQPGENIVAQAKNNTTSERYQGAGTGTDVPLVFDSIAGYDEELAFVSGSFKSLVFNYQVPVGVKYIKLAMGQTILDRTNTDMSELAIVNSDGTIYPYQPYSEQNATVKMNALPVDDTTVGNHLWSANKINEFQAAVQGEFTQLETDLTGTVQGAIGDMNTAFTQKSAELDTKFDTLEGSIQAEQEAFETEIEGALASQKTELETEIGEVASDVQSLSGSVTTQGQAISNLTGIVTNVESRVDTLETDMAAAKADISDLEDSDAQQTSDITELKGRMTTAEGEIDTLQTASEEHTTAISNLQAKDAELVSDINGLTTRIGSAEGDIDLLEGRADTLEGEIPILEAGIVNLEENKADKVGYEKDLNVGGADMLIGNGTITDNEAYNFRRTADGNRNVGNRETDEIIGGTLVVNQLIRISPTDLSKTENGVTITDNRDGTYTVSTDANGATADTQLTVLNRTYIQGRKIFIKGSPANGSASTYFLTDSWHDNAGNETGNGNIYNCSNGNLDIRITVKSGTIITTPITFKPQLVDLTQLFGSSSIADYVYNLEQTTAGAGIAWLYEYFPFLNGGYIPHNTGTLQSIVLSKHRMTEFNLLDEDTILPSLGFTKQSDGSFYAMPLVVYDQVIFENRKLQYNGQFHIHFMYKFASATAGFRIKINYTDGTSTRGTISNPSTTFTEYNITSTSGKTVRNIVTDYASNVGSYIKDFCISFSSDRNGEYEPYTVHEYSLDSSKELRGAPKIDSNGKLYFDGDRYKDLVTKRFILVDLSSFIWIARGNGIFSLGGTDRTIVTKSSVVCIDYAFEIPLDVSALSDKAISTFNYYNYKDLVIKDSTYANATASEFRTAMTGKMALVQLATSTTETAEAIPNPQICSPYGTEEYIDPRVEAGTIPFAIPTGHETVYNTSLDYKLNQIPNLPTAAGVYKLQVTVTSGVPSYSWVAEE